MIWIAIEFVIITILTAMLVTGKASGYWWLLLVPLLIDWALLIRKSVHRSKIKEIPPLEDTFEYTGAQFEQYVADVLRALGYQVESVGKTGDQGVDLIARKWLMSIAVQVKCYSEIVGNKAVQEVIAGKKYYRLHKAMVVTNSIFSRSAKELADRAHVVLWDKRTLARYVRRARKGK